MQVVAALPEYDRRIQEQAGAAGMATTAAKPVDLEKVLWTDPDVLFVHDIDSCSLPTPNLLSIGPEVGGQRLHTGWVLPAASQSFLNVLLQFVAAAARNSAKLWSDAVQCQSGGCSHCCLLSCLCLRTLLCCGSEMRL